MTEQYRKWLKRTYKKYNKLNIDSIKEAISLEKRLEELKKNTVISLSSYYARRKELILLKRRYELLYQTSLNFSDDFSFTVYAYKRKDILDKLDYVNLKIRELDCRYNYGEMSGVL